MLVAAATVVALAGACAPQSTPPSTSPSTSTPDWRPGVGPASPRIYSPAVGTFVRHDQPIHFGYTYEGTAVRLKIEDQTNNAYVKVWDSGWVSSLPDVPANLLKPGTWYFVTAQARDESGLGGVRGHQIGTYSLPSGSTTTTPVATTTTSTAPPVVHPPTPTGCQLIEGCDGDWEYDDGPVE